MARERALWISHRQPFMRDFLHRLAFIDETSLKTNMIKTTGWAPRGERLIDHAPHGHWNTQTFRRAFLLEHNAFLSQLSAAGLWDSTGGPEPRTPAFEDACEALLD